MPIRIQHGVDTKRELERLEEDVHAAPRPKTLHNEKGKSLLFSRIIADCILDFSFHSHFNSPYLRMYRRTFCPDCRAVFFSYRSTAPNMNY